MAIISDTHFGDPLSAMARRDKKSGRIVPGSLYAAFRDALVETLGKNIDFLVLLGDIFDFSVTHYAESFAVGQFFFQQIRQDKLAREMIYLPGNHDFDLWHTVEYQVNIIHQLERHRLPASFRMSVPGVLDARPGRKKYAIPGVTAANRRSGSGYGGLFLDRITSPATRFNFNFPNLYLLTDSETILLTHGQYFEAYWSLMAEQALALASPDLKKNGTRLPLSLTDRLAINFPLSQLACSGTGQAGPLSQLIRELQQEIRDRQTDRVARYMRRFAQSITAGCRFPLNVLFSLAYHLVRKSFLSSIGRIEVARFDEAFTNRPEVRRRFSDFFNSSLQEIDNLNTTFNLDIPFPTAVIFGHTHQPISWQDAAAPSRSIRGRNVRLYNSGGWLEQGDRQDLGAFSGAEIFFLSPDQGFFSRRIV